MGFVTDQISRRRPVQSDPCYSAGGAGWRSIGNARGRLDGSGYNQLLILLKISHEENEFIADCSCGGLHFPIPGHSSRTLLAQANVIARKARSAYARADRGDR